MPTAFITAPDGEASSLARDLVEHRLAACVNRFPCHSTYRWEDDIVEDDEIVLLAKTTDARYTDLVDFVLEHHPYETPCVERFDEADVLGAFAEWRDACCRPVEGDD